MGIAGSIFPKQLHFLFRHLIKGFEADFYIGTIALIKKIEVNMRLVKGAMVHGSDGVPLFWFEQKDIPGIPGIYFIFNGDNRLAGFYIKKFIVKNDPFMYGPGWGDKAVHCNTDIGREMVEVHICTFLFKRGHSLW